MLKEYRIVGYYPPKHVYVDLQDVSSGKIYEHQYVSKHCNKHCGQCDNSDIIGNIVTLPYHSYRLSCDTNTADSLNIYFDIDARSLYDRYCR